MVIIIYFLVGVLAFGGCQYLSARYARGTNDYCLMKVLAWTALIIWPFVLLILGVGLTQAALVDLDEVINKFLRKEK